VALVVSAAKLIDLVDQVTYPSSCFGMRNLGHATSLGRPTAKLAEALDLLGSRRLGRYRAIDGGLT
ncbi:MAG: hypothetical protein RL670_1267, partial [Actinomycetota bacterium]